MFAGLGLWMGSQAPSSGGGGGGGATGPAWDTAINAASFTFSNSNRTVTYAAAGSDEQARVSSAKSPTAYTGDFTVTPTFAGGDFPTIGLIDPTVGLLTVAVGNNTKDIGYWFDGRVANSGGLDATYTAYTTGQAIKVRIVNGLVGFAINGTWQNSYNPATGANGINISGFGMTTIIPAASCKSTGSTLVIDATNWV